MSKSFEVTTYIIRMSSRKVFYKHCGLINLFSYFYGAKVTILPSFTTSFSWLMFVYCKDLFVVSDDVISKQCAI